MSQRLLRTARRAAASPITATVLGFAAVCTWYLATHHLGPSGAPHVAGGAYPVRLRAPSAPRARLALAQPAGLAAPTEPRAAGAARAAPPDPPTVHQELLELQQLLDTEAQPALESAFRLTQGLVRRRMSVRGGSAGEPGDLPAQLGAAANQLNETAAKVAALSSGDSSGELTAVLRDSGVLTRLSANLLALSRSGGEEQLTLARQAGDAENELRQWIIDCEQRIADPNVRVARADTETSDQ